MMPNNRRTPATDAGLAPFLFCNEITVAADGAPLACPQCAGPNPHLDAIHFATPTDEHYTPTVGLTIDLDTRTVHADDQARTLHAGPNRGPMLAISYWCEEGCRGRIELREHKGHLFAGLHTERPMRHDVE